MAIHFCKQAVQICVSLGNDIWYKQTKKWNAYYVYTIKRKYIGGKNLLLSVKSSVGFAKIESAINCELISEMTAT